MKILLQVTLVILLQIASDSVYAQATLLPDNKVYGLDPLLHNGQLYSYFLPAGTTGSQFLFDPNFYEGTVEIRGIQYDHIQLNYDAYNQQLIYRFKTRSGNEQLIIISDAWLNAFQLGNAHFKVLAIADTSQKIYQIIGNGQYQVLYRWKKNLSLDNSIGATNHRFSKPIKESYLSSNTQLSRFKNNKTFISAFSYSSQIAVKKYLRQHKIKVKKASDQTISELLNFCNTLSTK